MTGKPAIAEARPASEGRLRGVAGWEYVHVMVDDHSRLAYAEVLDDLTASCAVAFLRRARRLVCRARRARPSGDDATTAPATSPTPTRSPCASSACATCASRPGRPRTNGKAERFIQTLLNEWAYARIYGSSDERAAALPLFLDALQLQTTTRLPRPPTTGLA